EDPESAVVFCNTKDETERVAEALKSRGYDADWLNGDLEQRERERVMQATREGKLRFLVATDVAARGIDISHLTHVINADFPESAEQYVHRTGRTGRAGRTGTAISVVGPKDVGHLYMLRLTYKIRPIERMLPTQGELRTRAEADMIAFLADAYAGKAQDQQHRAIARRLLTHDSAEIVIAGLLADHLGASSGDTTQEAADARRAKNPPPSIPEVRTEERREPRRADREPRTLRDGEKPPIPADRSARRDRGPERDRGGERRVGRPHSALRDWEPAPENDDDAPLFRDDGTKPGLGPKAPEAERTEAQAPNRDRGDRGDRGRRHRRDRDRPAHEAGAGAETIDNGRPTPRGMPSYHIEDEPTVVFGGRLPKPNEAEPPSREDRDADDPSFTNVFLNVGRRDGLRVEDVQRLLVENAGLAEADVGHIRLRDRITFVGIRKEHSERAIKALVGVVVGDRTVNAEPARDR
ncbi:MAG: DEAD-box ATP-dependent helicase CshA, partial [Labilithrix sp.]|nr:DEAD-box ATP-dependent helicase CshA [Labilithrix sp.]